MLISCDGAGARDSGTQQGSHDAVCNANTPILRFLASTSSRSCVTDCPVPGVGAAALCVSCRWVVAHAGGPNSNTTAQRALIRMAEILRFGTGYCIPATIVRRAVDKKPNKQTNSQRDCLHRVLELDCRAQHGSSCLCISTSQRTICSLKRCIDVMY